MIEIGYVPVEVPAKGGLATIMVDGALMTGIDEDGKKGSHLADVWAGQVVELPATSASQSAPRYVWVNSDPFAKAKAEIHRLLHTIDKLREDARCEAEFEYERGFRDAEAKYEEESTKNEIG